MRNRLVAVLLFVIVLFIVVFLIPNLSQTPQEKYDEEIPNTICKAAVLGHNHLDYDRINVVFVGYGIDKEQFASLLPYYVDVNASGFTTTVKDMWRIRTEHGLEVKVQNKTITFYGLLGTEPFKSNKEKFNFWYVDDIQNVSTPKVESDYCNAFCFGNAEDVCGLKNVYAVYLCNDNCTSWGSWWLNKAIVGQVFHDDGFNPYSIRIAIHEFGHGFGDLRDEYTLTDGGNQSGYPNCAPDLKTAKKWWGDLVGKGEGEFKIGYFYGCSYIKENVKPTNTSLMQDAASPLLGFGLVNEQYMQKKLDMFSGAYSANITEKDAVNVTYPNRTARK